MSRTAQRPVVAVRRVALTDRAVVVGGLAFIGVATAVGGLLRAAGVPVHATAAPIFGTWSPHLGPGTPAALAVAAVVITTGPAVAARTSWGRLLAISWVAAATWALTLALVDGWRTGVAGRLSTPAEYLVELPDLPPPGELLSTFVSRIPTDAADPWATHVSGHPPGVLFLLSPLHDLGLRGGGIGLVCIAVGTSAVVAVAVTVRALCGEAAARRVLPFLVLTPAALWVAVSGDALFLGISAWGIALLALASRRDGAPALTLAATGGVVLGYSLFLSYGLVLLGPLALLVLVRDGRWTVFAAAAGGVAAVVLLFAAGGFWWWDGYQAVRGRYADGYGGSRPYAYWVWADFAALMVALGPAVWVGLRRLRPRSAASPLVLAALAAVVFAALSGLAKAEVERIWLPFGVWLVVATVALPARDVRRWLSAQALGALVVAHLLALPW